MDSELQLTLLGQPQVRWAGASAMRFSRQKSLALLCYLARDGRSHCRETLAALLWGDASEASARANLRNSLAELRRHVPAHLIVSRTEVAFDRERPYWLDVEAFEDRVARALTLRGGPLAGEGAAALSEAVELVRGGFMEGFLVQGAPAFEEWILMEREHLQMLALLALEALVDYHAARGGYAQAMAYADHLLGLEPAHEEAHRYKMLLLALSGQRAAALRQYRVCHTALVALDAEPDEQTTTLHRQISAGAALVAPSRAPPHNLPAPLTPLVGREVDLAEIGVCLHDPACRLLTLVGPGGSGKTRLALEVAAAMLSANVPAEGMLTGDMQSAASMRVQGLSAPQRGSFDDGVFFVPLVAVPDVEALAPTLGQALDVPLSGRDPPRRQLLDFVRGKRLLLVLDGLEHLLAGAGLVVDLLRAAPAVKVLVTSQARLDVEGEHLFPVRGLKYPEHVPGDRETLASFPAIQLFVSSVRRIQRGTELTDADLVDVARICRLVGGLPLGLLLAAGWAGMLSPGEIAARLSREDGQGLNLLETDLYDLPARQRSMRAVFDYSWRLLTEQEQRVLGALAVLHGSFDECAAKCVAGASLRQLRSLVDKSVLHQASQGRYQLHDLLRRYAGEKLEDVPGAAEAARERHGSHFAAALQARTAALKGPRQGAALAEIETDSENVRAAWSWAVERGQVALLDHMIEGLCYFLKWRGRYGEGHRACQMAAERLSAQNLPSETSADGLRVLSRCLAWQGVFSQRLGHSALGNQLLGQSLHLLDDPELAGQDTRPERAFALWRLGRLKIDSDRQVARGLCQQSLTLYRALDDRWGAANALNALGEIAWNLGAYDEAKPLFEECLAARRALGDHRGVADAMQSLSRIALYQGSVEESERLLHRSVALCRRTGNRIGVAAGLMSLGRTFGFLGQFARARSQIEEAIAIYRGLGVSVPMTGVHLAAAHLHLGQYEEARAQAEMALERCRDADFSRGVGLACWLLGREALAREEYDEAQSLLQRSVAVLREIGQQDELSSALATLGIAAPRCGSLSQAIGCLYEALRTATKIRAFMPLTFALPALALMHASQGKPEQAVELYTLASRYPSVANSRWFEDMAGRHIAAVAATLPADVLQAAQERGRSGELWTTARELLAELQAKTQIEDG